MRKILVIIAGIAVIPTGLACQHTAGKCDCSPITPPCAKYGLNAGGCDAPKADVLPPAAPPRAMPPVKPAGLE